jgi:hypothetical protein
VNTPEGFLDAWNQGREALIQRFAQEQFALTEEEAIALETNTVEEFPRQMAKVLFTAISGAQRLMTEQLPLMVQSLQRQASVRTEAETQFFSKFPHLKNAQYMDEIQRVANVYKQLYPQMSLDERIAAIGSIVTSHFKIAVPQVAAVPATQGGPQVVAQRVLHTPAAAGGGAARGAALSSESDPFAGAFQDWE